MNEFTRCLETGRIEMVAPDPEWVSKEMAEAGLDLARARRSLQEGEHKWAIIQGYYSMFHAAKALVLKAGYREKSHVCLSIALRHLYVGHSEVSEQDFEKLVGAMYLRNEADYDLVYSEEVAGIVVENATSFLKMTHRVIG